MVYLSTRSGHPVNFPNLFYDLCKLVPEEAAKYLDQLYKDTKQSIREQMQALLAEFPQGRTIVLLDNFEDVVDAEAQAIKEGELDEALRAILEAPPHGLKFILTTRVAPQALLRVLPGLQDSLELDQGLKSPYAENVLKAMDTKGTLGLNAPDAPLAEAREATRGFPRALEAVVGILRADRSTDLRGLLKELRQLGSKAEDVVRDLVGEAFNRLEPLAQEVMQALAIYGAPVPAVAVDYLLQPYRIGIDSSKTLSRLVSMQFVRSDAGRYHLHQVDRDYALSRLVEGEPEDRKVEPPPLNCYALRHRAAEYFKKTRKPLEASRTLEDLAPQLAEFELRFAGEDYDAAASVLIEIDDSLSLWGHYRLLAERYERLLQGRLADPVREWESTFGLGNAYTRIGRFQEAIRCFDHSLAIARDKKIKELEANSLAGFGFVYGDIGDHHKAIEFDQYALAMYEDLRNKEGEAIARGNLASDLQRLGRSAEAIKHFEKAIALHKGTGNYPSECRDTYNLANAYCDLGENGEASKLAEDALQLARKIGYRLLESAAMCLKGDLKVRECRFEDASGFYEEAIRTADEANSIQIQVSARNGLAFTCLLTEDLPRARAVSDEAVKYRFPISYASILAMGGVIALRQGDTTAARKSFDMALIEADKQMSGAEKSYYSAYAKALALAGLSLCQDVSLATAAAESYRNARAVSATSGIVQDQLQMLDALAVADSTGKLKLVRIAAAGEG